MFPDGDRGGNSIKIGSRGNLHSTWDGLLGGSASSGDVLKRVAKLKNDKATVAKVIAHRDSFGADSSKWIDAELWLMESRKAGRQYVYNQEILEPVTVAARGLVDEVHIPQLSEAYLVEAGRVARIRATQAGYRLEEVLSDGEKRIDKS